MQGIYDFGSMKMEIKENQLQKSLPNWKNYTPVKDLDKTPLPKGFTPIPVQSFSFEENYLLYGWDPVTCP